MFWTSELGPIMDDITFYRNMLNLVCFFDNRLWREVVVSIWCLALMCRSFLTTKESVSPPPTCHWGTRSFASQRSLAFSSPPGHKLHRPGKNQVDQFEAGMWPYGRQLNVTFWMKDLVLSYPDKISPSIQKKMYKVLPRLQNQPGLKGHWQTCPNPQKPFQRREEAPPRLRQLHIFLRLSYILKFVTFILLDCCAVVDVRLHWDASVLDIKAWNNVL